MKKQRIFSITVYLTTLFVLAVLSLIGGVKPTHAQTGTTGILNICKSAEGAGLENRIFQFRVRGRTIQVPVGACSGPLEFPAGQTSIEELTDGFIIGGGTFSGRFRLLSITSSVSGSLSSIILPARTAMVNIREGNIANQTIVTFTNTFAVNAVIEICKRAAPDATLNSGFFNFTVDVIPNQMFSIPVNACSGPIQVNIPTNPTILPVRADVTVTELGRERFPLQSITVTTRSTTLGNPLNEVVLGQGIRNTSDCIDERRDAVLNAVLPDFTLPFNCFFTNPAGGFVSADVQEGGTANQTTFTFFDSGRRATLFDYDGDGRADVSVYRFSTNRWYERLSSNSVTAEQTFGLPGDIITPADFDGDGKTDIAIFRPSTGTWWFRSSFTGVQRAVRWGQSGDIPIPGDFDGDGRADFIVFRPTNRTWYRLSSFGQTSITEFGLSSDMPVTGDFDGDGKTDLAVYRTSTGTWWYLESTTGNVRSIKFGLQLDLPVPADYDGDGKTDIAVYRHSASTWYINNSSSNTVTIQKFGTSTDQPVAADYDGDGQADLAVYRPSEGMWYLLRSSEGFTAVKLGILSDIPTPAAFNYSIIIIA